ncbi:MAG: hypothetical protein PHP08_00395 [Candidatus Dojkabacteria bacterium]|nr:hypothetical protein [Candidatus Dojkabacteria bacterium]
MNNSTIVLLRPRKENDPTIHTYDWAEKAYKMMKSYGYTVIDIKKNEVTYNNVTKSLQYYRPRLVVTFSHGCPSSIQGQSECVITRKFDIDELLNMPNLREIIKPLIYSSGCVNTCLAMPDICNPLCMNETNVNLLKDTIVFTVACYSASQLGKCAIRYGAEVYSGYTDLMLFPVDSIHSQDIFRDIHLVFLKALLEGKTVGEAEYDMNRYEDAVIKFYKKTKYVSLPALWNKLHRNVLGNKNARMF